MLDPEKYTRTASAGHGLPPSHAQAPDAPAPAAFAPEPEFAAPHAPLAVSGPAWAEYHLLLDTPREAVHSEPQFTRIEREIRTLGGAPAVAVLLARWSFEVGGSSAAPVELSLALGHDPNARLLRRELESWATRLPNLRLRLSEEGALEVPYRILMWPGAASTCTSTCSWHEPTVLECGGFSGAVSLRAGSQVLELPLRASAGHEVAQAARAWASLHSNLGEQSTEALARAALLAWRGLPAPERATNELEWRQVRLAAEAAAEASAQESLKFS